MRRPLACLTALAIVAILLAVAWAVFGPRLRTFYVAKRCEWAWKRVSDYQSDFELRMELGALSVPVSGTMWFKKPDRYRIDLGPSELTACRFIARSGRAWVYIPLLKVALDVSFKAGDPADVVRGQSPGQWIDQFLGSTDARVVGTDTVQGRECYVIELTPTAEQKVGSGPMGLSAAGELADPLVLVNRWQRTRVHISKKTALPVRGTALTDSDNPIFIWTARNLAVNQGLSDEHFEFRPPQDVTVVEREFDPDRPESLFLPPGAADRGLSWDDMTDALEEESERQLEDIFGGGAPNDPSSEPSLDGFLEGLEERLSGEERKRAPDRAEPAPADRSAR